MRSLSLALGCAVLGTLSPFLQAGESSFPVPKLSDTTYKKWLDFVRPNAEEDRWKKIGWRTSLSEAIGEAKALERPILLWTMNGHPCGTT